MQATEPGITTVRRLGYIVESISNGSQLQESCKSGRQMSLRNAFYTSISQEPQSFLTQK